MFKGLKSLIAGIAAGTALGVLFSPKKGKDIRDGIKKEIHKGGSGLSEIKETLVGMGKDLHETCKDCCEDVCESKDFKEGKKKVVGYAKQAKKEAEKVYKKNLTATTRKKIKKGVKKAKELASTAVEKAKEAAEKLKKDK